MSYNIDMCDLILFMTKICPVSGIENKKVNVDVSYLDTSSNTLIVSHTDGGILENLLGKCFDLAFANDNLSFELLTKEMFMTFMNTHKTIIFCIFHSP